MRWFSRSTPDRATNVNAALPFTLATDVGLSREENQDRVGAIRVLPNSPDIAPFLVIAIADGMGGMRDGALCAIHTLAAFFSELATNEIPDQGRRLALAADRANAEVFDLFGGAGGATLSAICINSTGAAALVNIGDSRIYGVGNDPASVRRLTVDDSLEEAVGGHGRDLLQFVGMGPSLRAHVSDISADVHRLLITSDGIHFISHEALCGVFLNAPDIYRVTERLIALARWCGAPDNASLAAVNFDVLKSLFEPEFDTPVSVWDPFSCFEIFYPKEQLSKSVGASGKAASAVKKGAGSQSPQPEGGALVEKKTRKRRPKKESIQSKSTSDGPQLVIEIDDDRDPTASEKSGETST
ncbi:PP2C family protein-serine/threonine phosphatase [Ralstonia solanacearum]|uniref:PP2C family protein-serine/threonine phosphatase n=1 Tax=Ralstonia solanacearum TaxID=305 RepID=UPI0011A6534A|nr:hypothetical protein [Ralstonia solanacearum]MCL9824595.1 hypothetical protein [Ralstonia solanacearum]MCL9830028.1 hypothetical protein [Ralstonia solanacearum]MCL9834809.1 hypothetical protein [Ralstonia solanacearum]